MIAFPKSFIACLLLLGERVAKFLTSWSRDLAKTRFDVSDGIRKKVIAQLILVSLVAFTFALMYFLPHYVFSSSGIHLVQDTVKATRIVLIRPFATDPLEMDQYLHPYFLELPILILVLMLVASYKVRFEKSRGLNFFKILSHFVGIRVLLWLRLPVTSQWIQRMEQKGARFFFFQTDGSQIFQK